MKPRIAIRRGTFVLAVSLVLFTTSIRVVIAADQPAVGEQNTVSVQTSGYAIFPASIELTGNGSSASFVVQRQFMADGQPQTIGPQITQGLTLELEDPQVAEITGGRVTAVGNGTTTLHVKLGDVTLGSVAVRVAGAEQPLRWQFDAHVQSIFARQGCNSGGCHGALSGKGGFRLSLRGYDSVADHFTITRQDHGRRIEPADPGRSLLLAKPSMLLPHKGGLRLAEGSLDYRVLAEWIAGGALGPQPSSESLAHSSTAHSSTAQLTKPQKATGVDENRLLDADLVNIEVLPTDMRLSQEDQQQLVVRAHYADGRIEDVTHWAKFSSANETVTEVDEFGRVEMMGPGKGPIAVWFGSRIAMASVVVPFQEQTPLAAYVDFKPANIIDEVLLDEWRALGLAPSPGCSDETFVRRAFIDTTGTIPTPNQLRDFLGDAGSDRRARLVDELLASQAYVDYWSYQWSNLLLVNGNLLRPDAVAAFYTWIRKQVTSNTPWDEFAREIVLAKGESTQQGATNFYAIHQDPESLTENTCQAFMGLSIGCAKCHNHPLEKWTNDQYYAMANLYARVRAKGWGGDARNGDGKRTLVVLDRGDLIQPSRGKAQPPTPLDAQPLDVADTSDRRVALAQWLTGDDNRYFSRAIANRVWAAYMGVGLVESVDDLRASNPASSERLLDALADYLIEHNYDLKSLMRLILSSQTYQRTAEANANNLADKRFYCRYYPRRLMAEVLHDAVVQVTGVPTEFKEIEFVGADKKPTEIYPAGTSALELYDSAVVNYFLKTFGRHQRRITCDCERSDQPTVVQVLHLNNGDTLNEKLANEKSVIRKWIAEDLTAAEVIDQAYLLSLSRGPSADERSRMLKLVADADQAEVLRAETFQDLLWSLMTSREFLFAH